MSISPKTRQKSNKENRKFLIIKDFRFLLRDSVGITSLRSVFPSSAGHHRQMRRSALARFRCCSIPRLRSSKLGLPGIKQQRLTFVRRLICRDSVGIRTQDPQLRRLLLYPAELPNRSVWLLGCQRG